MDSAAPGGATPGPGLEEPAGEATVLRMLLGAKLRCLAGAAQLPGVTLQVVPIARGGHAAAGGSFSISRFGERDLPDVVYTGRLTSAVYLNQRPDVEHCLEVAGQLSGEALTPPAGSIRFIEHTEYGT